MNIQEEFYKRYGMKLDEILPSGQNEQDKVKRYIEQQKNILETYCQSFNPYFSYDKLKDKEIFDSILLVQMWYVVNTHDFSILSGLENNANLPLSEISERIISPFAKQQLKNYGFCYRGII